MNIVTDMEQIKLFHVFHFLKFDPYNRISVAL